MKDDFFLFKYFSIDGKVTPKLKRIDVIKKLILNNEIYLPSLETLNDPFELIFNSNKGMDASSSINKDGVLSFTTNYNNILMWAHYSGSHSGIAIKFRVDKNNSKDFKKVQYIQEQQELNYLDKILVKSSEWSYENEYRFVAKKSSTYLKLADIGLTIDGLIFGFKCPENQQEILKKLCIIQDLNWGTISLDEKNFSCEVRNYHKDEYRVLRDILEPAPPEHSIEYDAEYIEDMYASDEKECKRYEREDQQARSSKIFKKFLKKKEKLKLKYV